MHSSYTLNNNDTYIRYSMSCLLYNDKITVLLIYICVCVIIHVNAMYEGFFGIYRQYTTEEGYRSVQKL